jgi:RNA polymerase-binding protein DksA
MDRDRDRIGRDSMDESIEEELYSTQLRLHDRETFLIAKIQDALKRLDAGEIDECEECSEPIGFRRLMARPMTTLCFDCKTAREQVEAGRGGGLTSARGPPGWWPSPWRLPGFQPGSPRFAK